MSSLGLILSVGLLLLAGIWVMLPLLRRGSARKSDDALIEKQHDRLNLLYERILTNIRDLDEDYSTGKMNAGDYESEREVWVQHGVEVLRALDQLGTRELFRMETPEELATDAETEESVDDAIEAAIAAYRGKAKT